MDILEVLELDNSKPWCLERQDVKKSKIQDQEFKDIKLFKNISIKDLLALRARYSINKGRMVNALALGAEEGRDWQAICLEEPSVGAITRGFPNEVTQLA